MPELSSASYDAPTPARPRRNRGRFGALAATVASVLAVGVLGGSTAFAGRHGQEFGTEHRLAAATAPDAAPSPAPSASPTPGASAAGPSTGAAVSALPAPDAITPTHPVPVPTSKRSTTAPKPAATATCKPRGVADMLSLYNMGDAVVGVRVDGVSSDQLCPGERVRVFWATYVYDAAGVAQLTGSQVYWLDQAQPTVHMQLRVDPDYCHSAWFIARGSDAIPTTLAPGVVPFVNKMNWDYPAIKPSCQ